MHAGRHYSFWGFLVWTRRELVKLFFLALIPTVLYRLCGFKFLSISWVPIAMLGTAVSFIVGFKNNASYNRLWEARQIYGGIINASRAFGVMVRDFLPPADQALVATIFDRHFAWLTALRYQLREPRIWENMQTPANIEYARFYVVPEYQTPLAEELSKYLAPAEQAAILAKKNRATQLMAAQSAVLNGLADRLTELQLMQLQTAVTNFYDLQGRVERIKNFPYPRNFSSISTILLYLFVLLLPFGLIKEFNELGKGTFLEGYTVWFNIPFALMLTWVFVALDIVGDSSTNPFEGGANDVPISNISRTIEIDMREMLGQTELPPAITPVNDILV
jgi:ion channel-forming bestrophin family protein